VTVDPTVDTSVETDETVALTLAAGTGYTVGTTTAVVGTISNDDTTVTLAVSPATAAEDGSSNLVYTFTRTGVTTNALTVNYSVGGTATLGSDYSGIVSGAGTKTVTFAAGASTATVIVDPTVDSSVEANETVELTLAAGTGYNVGTATAVVGTISNDDTSVTLAVSPGTAAEDGSSNLVYTFTRTGVTTTALTVNYSVGGTATLGSDYTGIATGAGTKTVTFAAGSATALVTVDPTADTTVEADETVELTLAAGTGYNVGTATAVVGTMTNDDTTVTLAVSPGTAAEDGSSDLVYTFTRTGVTTNALTVNYTVGGTASLGSDYTGIAATPATKTVSFAAGASTALVTVDPTVDTSVETDETVALTLAAGTGYTVGTTTAVVGTIANDDVASAVTATLTTNQSSLALTGTANTNGTGNDTNNIISGNGGDNILDGKDGVDTLTGLGGADTFLFSTVPTFGAPTADHITDFNAGQGDLLGISRVDFGIPGAVPVSLITANSDPALSTAFSSDNIFVYDSRNGNLYFDQNGSADGFGSGGIFAVIDNKPALIASNISLV
jgi:hypothetical protein